MGEALIQEQKEKFPGNDFSWSWYDQEKVWAILTPDLGTSSCCHTPKYPQWAVENSRQGCVPYLEPEKCKIYKKFKVVGQQYYNTSQK
jgi:hypothetical protein